MEILQLTSGDEVKQAYEEMLTNIPAGSDYDGHRSIAKNVANGMPGFFEMVSKMQGHKFYKLDNNGKTWGLLRLVVKNGVASIDNVSAVSATKLLVIHGKEIAKAAGCTSIKLSTADAHLKSYYQKFGFVMKQANAQVGEMNATL